jgi:hypothetical protein
MNLKIISGDYFQTLRNSQGNDGEKVQSDPEGQLICKSTCMEIIIDSIILTDVNCCVITYTEVREKRIRVGFIPIPHVVPRSLRLAGIILSVR